MKLEPRYFKTTKFALATFLYAKNQVIVGINPVGPGVKEFVFPLTPEIEELVDIYKFSPQEDERLYISVKKYEQSRSELMSKLKD